LKTSTKRNDEPEDEMTKSSENENLNLFVKGLGSISKRKVIKRGTLPNNLSQILLISLVIVMESKDISRLNSKC